MICSEIGAGNTRTLGRCLFQGTGPPRVVGLLFYGFQDWLGQMDAESSSPRLLLFWLSFLRRAAPSGTPLHPRSAAPKYLAGARRVYQLSAVRDAQNRLCAEKQLYTR